MPYLSEKDLQGIIWKYLGHDAVERLKGAGAWREFDVYSQQVLEAHERIMDKIAMGQYPMNVLQKEIALADAEIAQFVSTVNAGKSVSANLVVGNLSMKEPFHMIHQFRVLYMVLMGYFRDRIIREEKPATVLRAVQGEPRKIAG